MQSPIHPATMRSNRIQLSCPLPELNRAAAVDANGGCHNDRIAGCASGLTVIADEDAAAAAVGTDVVGDDDAAARWPLYFALTIGRHPQWTDVGTSLMMAVASLRQLTRRTTFYSRSMTMTTSTMMTTTMGTDDVAAVAATADCLEHDSASCDAADCVGDADAGDGDGPSYRQLLRRRQRQQNRQRHHRIRPLDCYHRNMRCHSYCQQQQHNRPLANVRQQHTARTMDKQQHNT